MKTKFKAENEGKVYEVYSINWEDKEVALFIKDWGTVGYVGLDQIKLLQFVGLYDDYGKEIYAGDIVEIHHKEETKTSYKSEVIFNYNGALVTYHPAHIQVGHVGYRQLAGYCDYGVGADIDVYCKIVDNIYENPELLND